MKKVNVNEIPIELKSIYDNQYGVGNYIVHELNIDDLSKATSKPKGESPNDQDQRPGEPVDLANQTVVPGSLDRLVGLAPELNLSKSEKQEVIEWIKLVHPQSLNSTIVLDKSDIPYDLKDTLFFFSQDKSETQLSSSQFLSSVRQYKASQNQDRAGQNEM